MATQTQRQEKPKRERYETHSRKLERVARLNLEPNPVRHHTFGHLPGGALRHAHVWQSQPRGAARQRRDRALVSGLAQQWAPVLAAVGVKFWHNGCNVVSMKTLRSSLTLPFAVGVLAPFATGCQVVEAIFKAGMWVGVLSVVLVLGLLAWGIKSLLT